MRPVSSCTSSSVRGPSSSTISNHVTASRGVGVSSEWRDSVDAVAADRRLDPARPRARRALDEREIAALDLAAADRLLEPRVRLLGAGDDEQAGGVAVEPVDDPGPVVVAAGRVELEQPVHERSRRVAGARVNDEAGGLVDDEEVLVLPDDVEIHRLGRERTARRGQLDDDVLPALEPVALRPAARRRRARRRPAISRSASPREPISGARRERAVEPPASGARKRRVANSAGGASLRSAPASAAKRIATPTTMKVSARLNAGQ